MSFPLAGVFVRVDVRVLTISHELPRALCPSPTCRSAPAIVDSTSLLEHSRYPLASEPLHVLSTPPRIFSQISACLVHSPLLSIFFKCHLFKCLLTLVYDLNKLPPLSPCPGTIDVHNPALDSSHPPWPLLLSTYYLIQYSYSVFLSPSSICKLHEGRK